MQNAPDGRRPNPEPPARDLPTANAPQAEQEQTISAHLHNEDTLLLDFETVPFLSVVCAGYHRVEENYKLERPKGRMDYQIIYLWKGCGHFVIGGQEVTLEAGNVLIYHPWESQVYDYYVADGNENFWVHFFGYAVPEILIGLGLWEKRIFHVGRHNDLADAFDRIIQTCITQDEAVEYNAGGLLLQLLSLLSRHSASRGDTTASRDLQKLFPAINAINESYQDDRSTPEYAAMCHLSPSRFTHIFTQSMGMSPTRYKHTVRINHATDLLTHTRMSIREIAAALGYDDPLYFSRRFKQITGCSPQNYRESGHRPARPDAIGS